MNTTVPAVSPAKAATPPPAAVSPAKAPASIGELKKLPLAALTGDPNQARKHFDEGALKELAESIKADGLIHPVVVRPHANGGGVTHRIVDGERRFRAAKLAGLTEIPCIVRADLDDRQATTAQLVANIQREDLTLPEQCEAVARLVAQISFADACRVTGKSAAWVSKRVNALKAPDQLVKLVKAGKIADLEVIGGLAELSELDRDEFEGMLQNVGSEDPYDRVDRTSVREAVEQAKEQKKWEAEARAREEADAKKAKSKPAAGKAPKEDDLSVEEKAARARESKINRVKEERRALKEAADAALYKSLQLQRKGFSDPLDLRYGNDFPGAGSSDYAKFPATAEAAKFEVYSYGDITHLKRIAAGLPGNPIVALQPMELSLEDAQRVSDALKGRPGAKQLDMHFQHEITGAQLRAMVGKLAPSLASSLPPPRGEEGARGKAAPAKKAAPAVKKTSKKKGRK